VRLSVILLIVSLAGILGGGWLCGPLAFGIAVMCDSVALGAYALLRDSPDRPEPVVTGVPTLHDILERARSS
jgi:hypothetical protein